jgi:hypothetical protein
LDYIGNADPTTIKRLCVLVSVEVAQGCHFHSFNQFIRRNKREREG